MHTIEFLKELLTFPSSDKKAIITLLVLMGGLMAFKQSMPYWVAPPEKHIAIPQELIELRAEILAAQATYDYGKDKEAYSNFNTGFGEGQSSWKNKDYTKQGKYGKDKVPLQLKLFDPNKLNLENGLAMGLPQRVAKSIANYTKKGGRFKIKSDLKKIYGLEESLYQQLYDYIDLPEQKNYTHAGKSSSKSFVETENENETPPSVFDPNKMTIAMGVELGFSEKQARSICKYIENGGLFKTKDDFCKLRVVSDYNCERLSPYVQLEEKQVAPKFFSSEKSDFKEQAKQATSAAQKQESPQESEKEKKKYDYEPVLVDINTASMQEFEKLYGIGPTYARLIVGYREQLGGFVSPAQIAETYGIGEDTYQTIAPYLLNEHPELVKRININTADVESLNANIYIRKYKNAKGQQRLARQIIRTREKYGNYDSLKGLLDFKLVDKAFFEKIKPYLLVE